MLFGALLFSSAPLLAQVVVPASASFSLNGGSIDLAGSNLQVAGTFDVAAGAIQNAANIGILAGGAINGGSGTITLFGDFSNVGSFTAGSSHVNFVDGALAQSNITGNTTFANLSFVSLTGKSYVFGVGSTQSIQSQLQILGTAGFGIQIKSSTAGQVAFINLLAGGTQDINYVGVSNVHAIGIHLAPSLTNDGGTGDSFGWFAAVAPTVATPIPTLSFGMLLLLALAFSGMAFAALRRSFK
ncbi:hypothetical protein ELE36_13500 [Pseudolysobacter antarcticus]|uniref:IPTL-CTERM sorting domain-containing protein n=1 Tax=Pseudolysobacter antarcticus TaxID=2511995 RepID=A0A411HLC3_9GAMM|nr:hypothetical protein [Pseudolysobacter antarcticus]QBB71288.1 hypothetical protein ELE36_13500 [Pseudolysobacter antarcticus]